MKILKPKQINNPSYSYDRTNDALLASVFAWDANCNKLITEKLTFGNISELMIYGGYNLNLVCKKFDNELIILAITNIIRYYDKCDKNNMYSYELGEMNDSYLELKNLIVECKKYFEELELKFNKRIKVT